ncbi:E3 ubiquitin-protein ligase HOS1-like isoform X2 [Telopea speciosissima]|uniref:E3 ubiquitin-protein ligase HOS1-like isoform X2 n=1 Tax=Telopea speciosissima TaxID=54955 RepID=UPI001CC665C9|nr:E3 ubiquitin-protein ligase HOS1-like isoform X2 [Telopea speciosissima]
MERRMSLEGTSSPDFVDGVRDKRSILSSVQPNYDSGAVKEALNHLASIDLIELCNEAKVERCRATRDLRSCGCYVEYVLNSCGHASLCAECIQHCDLCPVCRAPLPTNGDRVRLRLYYECIEAGLISKRYDDSFQEKDGDKHLSSDVERLYCLFDVALDNNLVSLICHYVTDVCMDESAVSSDPMIAFLLDEVVVKDWCKRTFRNIITDLQNIYTTLEIEEMKSKLDLLPKFVLRLTGVFNVLEVLESSFKGTLSAQFHDLHHLQENVSKAKQHLEIMSWCIRHQFLENVRSRYSNVTAWRSVVCERKSAAIKRSWPQSINKSAGQGGSTLFIEDALSNLVVEQGYGQGIVEDVEVTSLQKDGGFSFFRSKTEGAEGCYPFENLRAGADILFLHGNSDMIEAKRAIFLYYLYDRHWTMPDEEWRHVVDDFAGSFGITRHSLLESLTFYLLDDHTVQALQEACHLLPEIAGPAMHPKITRVLLERQNPDAALMVLRWSGLDALCAYANTEHGELQLVSLCEAVTAVRVRVECGLLTEAFMYQRTHCTKVKEHNLKHGSFLAFSKGLEGHLETWEDQMEALVSEICFLCIRRNLVDRMIELPWNFDEERCLDRCLLEYAAEDPSTTAGSLLVVFYLQRFRYIEAYQVDRKLESLELDFISKTSIDEAAISRIRSMHHWRGGLVDKCIELLPEVQQKQVKAGSWPNIGIFDSKELETSDHPEVQQPRSTGLPSTADSLILRNDRTISPKETSSFGTPAKLGGSFSSSRFELNSYCPPSVLNGRFPTVIGGPSIPHYRDNLDSSQNSAREQRPQTSTRQKFNFNGTPPCGIRLASQSHSTSKNLNKGSMKVVQSNYLQDDQFDEVSPGMERNGFINHVENARPLYPRRVTADPMTTPNNDCRLKDFSCDSGPTLSGQPAASDKQWSMISPDDPMDVSWSLGNRNSAVEIMDTHNGLRWRSDEASEDEEEPSPEIIFGGASFVMPARGKRKSRLSRR